MYIYIYIYVYIQVGGPAAPPRRPPVVVRTPPINNIFDKQIFT